MQKASAIIGIVSITIILGCLDPYNPPESSANINYLVVDAFLNATESTCTAILSRTRPISEEGTSAETNAMVFLEDSNGLNIQLVEQNPGYYVASGLTLDYSTRYRIRIGTDDDKVFESEEISIYQTPAIDSITWRKTPTILDVFVNTHDPEDDTRYYRWRYTETWEYRSAFYSALKLVNDHVVNRQSGEFVYTCWRNHNSSDILVGSSEKMDHDIINLPITQMPLNSAKISVRYSILLEQRAVDQQTYQYYQQLKKITEDLGTIFDPLPSEIFGNIHCVLNRNETVLGYFTAATVEKQRIFISKEELDFEPGHPFDTGYEHCIMYTKFYGENLSGLIPLGTAYNESSGVPIPIGYHAATPECTDCTLQGGTNLQPDFW